jgi:hypothetical protein
MGPAAATDTSQNEHNKIDTGITDVATITMSWQCQYWTV